MCVWSGCHVSVGVCGVKPDPWVIVCQSDGCKEFIILRVPYGHLLLYRQTVLSGLQKIMTEEHQTGAAGKPETFFRLIQSNKKSNLMFYLQLVECQLEQKAGLMPQRRCGLHSHAHYHMIGSHWWWMGLILWWILQYLALTPIRC